MQKSAAVNNYEIKSPRKPISLPRDTHKVGVVQAGAGEDIDKRLLWRQDTRPRVVDLVGRKKRFRQNKNKNLEI